MTRPAFFPASLGGSSRKLSTCKQKSRQTDGRARVASRRDWPVGVARIMNLLTGGCLRGACLKAPFRPFFSVRATKGKRPRNPRAEVKKVPAGPGQPHDGFWPSRHVRFQFRHGPSVLDDTRPCRTQQGTRCPSLTIMQLPLLRSFYASAASEVKENLKTHGNQKEIAAFVWPGRH